MPCAKEDRFQKMSQCSRVIFHHNPHLDEVVGYWIARKFGEDRFPGIKTAELLFRRVSGLWRGKTWEHWWEEGTLLIGTGGGPFDEHAFGSEERKQGECAATLVAKFLGVENDPALQRILKYTLDNDTRASHHSLIDLASMVRNAHLFASEMSQREVVFMAMVGLETFYRKETAFWGSQDEFLEKGVIEEIADPRGVIVTAAAIESDNLEMARFLRSEHGINAGLVIQRGSRGNVQLLPAREKGAQYMDKLARLVRWREAELGGREPERNPEELAREGSIPTAPEWYYVHKQLLSGSHTAPDAPKTKIPTEELLKLAKLAIAGKK